MADKFWRCLNPDCSPTGIPFDGLEFYSPEPVCPSCKKSLTVIPLVHVHWLMPGGGNIRDHRIACMPDRRTLVGIHASSQPDAVTCPTCKKVEDYARKLADFADIHGRPLKRG